MLIVVKKNGNFQKQINKVLMLHMNSKIKSLFM